MFYLENGDFTTNQGWVNPGSGSYQEKRRKRAEKSFMLPYVHG
jgi:hypothetical protein